MSRDGDNLSFGPWSESEHRSVAGLTGSQLEGHYWYGKKRFESAVAWAVLRASYDVETIAGLDSALDNLIAAFEYRAQLNELRRSLQLPLNSNIADACANDRHAYLTVVGVVLSKGEDADKELLSRTLHREVASKLRTRNNNERPEDMFEAGSPDIAPTEIGSPPAAAASSTGEALRRRFAANALYQHGQRVGFDPVYVDSVSTSPPGKRVDVTCGNDRFHGIAHNNKLAKQAAAMRACEALGIQIEAGI